MSSRVEAAVNHRLFGVNSLSRRKQARRRGEPPDFTQADRGDATSHGDDTTCSCTVPVTGPPSHVLPVPLPAGLVPSLPLQLFEQHCEFAVRLAPCGRRVQPTAVTVSDRPELRVSEPSVPWTWKL